MGAASSFGKQFDDLGINSPTHRNTHAEEDLFDNNNGMSAATTGKPAPVFKTCPPPSPPSTRIDNHADFDFNPREDEADDFGDFTSAFAPTVTPVPAATSTSAAFAADFGSAFVDAGASNANSILSGANNGLLFETMAPQRPPAAEVSLFGSPLATNSTASLANIMAQPMAASAGGGSNDLLSDFGGLNMNTPVFNGECPHKLCFSVSTLTLALNARDDGVESRSGWASIRCRKHVKWESFCSSWLEDFLIIIGYEFSCLLFLLFYI